MIYLGKEFPENDEQIKMWKLFRKAQQGFAEFKREHKDYKTQYDDFFFDFFYFTEDLITAWEETVRWANCRVKAGILKASRGRLSYLRELIDKWLNEQQKPN